VVAGVVAKVMLESTPVSIAAPFRHCSRWKDQQKTLWKKVGKATGWRAGRCRRVKVSELLSIEKCDQAVMDFLAATDVGKCPPKMDGGGRAGGQQTEE